MQIIRLIYPFLAAGALAVMLYYLVNGLLAWRWGAHRLLADFQQPAMVEKGISP